MTADVKNTKKKKSTYNTNRPDDITAVSLYRYTSENGTIRDGRDSRGKNEFKVNTNPGRVAP